MANKLTDSLKLSTEHEDAVVKVLEADANVQEYIGERHFDAQKLAQTAAQILQILLGKEKVDTSPVDEKIVNQSWSKACWLTPSFIVLPQSKYDVSKILRVTQFFKLKFAIRSGGHSPNPGFSSIDGPGILIDFQKLDQVSISDDRKVVSLGPGGEWWKVYEFLDPYGVSVIGGRSPMIGVGGVILGGGFFHFSGEHGLAADNVLDFEIVLGDGSIVNANAKENSDLFWALKGGGSNFGIVTKFNVRAIPVRDIWYQLSIHPLDQADDIIDAFVKWQTRANVDLKGTVPLIFGLENITLGFIYSESTPPSGAFAEFDGLVPALVAVPPSTGTVHSLTEILRSIYSNEPQRHDYRGASSKIDAQLYKDVYKVWKEHASAAKEKTGAEMTFVLQPITSALSTVAKANGGNPMNIPEENHQWWTTLLDWKNAEDDEVVRGAAIATSEAWKKLGEERGLHLPYLFMNDASRDQDPLISYGEVNLEKMKQVSAKYDPQQVFQKLQNAGFLLKNM